MCSRWNLPKPAAPVSGSSVTTSSLSLLTPSVRLVEDDIISSIAAGDSKRLVFQPLGGTLGVSKDRLDVVTDEPLTGAAGFGRFHREHVLVFQVGHVNFHTAGLVVVNHKTYLSGDKRVHRHYNPCRP